MSIPNSPTIRIKVHDEPAALIRILTIIERQPVKIRNLSFFKASPNREENIAEMEILGEKERIDHLLELLRASPDVISAFMTLNYREQSAPRGFAALSICK